MVVVLLRMILLQLLVLDGGHILLLMGRGLYVLLLLLMQVSGWHIALTNACDVWWHVAPTGTDRRHISGVPYVCGGNSVSGGRASTNGDHEYVFGSEPSVSVPV
jgi:hypothetical protein